MEETLMKLDSLLAFLAKHAAASPFLARLLAVMLDCHYTRLPVVNVGFRYSAFWSKKSDANQGFSAVEVYLADFLFRWLAPDSVEPSYCPLPRTVREAAVAQGELTTLAKEVSGHYWHCCLCYCFMLRCVRVDRLHTSHLLLFCQADLSLEGQVAVFRQAENRQVLYAFLQVLPPLSIAVVLWFCLSHVVWFVLS
jgi:hypothetical protein